MSDYDMPDPASIVEIGLRARNLRELLGMTVERVAAEACVAADEVVSLEAGEAASLAAALAIHQIVSNGSTGADLFATPHFRTIEDVVAYERRRRARR